MWIKQGRLFHLEDSSNRSNHCQVPTPYIMADKIRIYYSCRNNGKSFITFIDIDRKTLEVIYVHEKPVFEHGSPGMFDADGVMPSCIVENMDEIWLYYIGWSELANTARYQNEIGIAVSTDGGETFRRKFEGPIMGRTKTEPGLAVMPFVMYQNWFRMWYQSGTGWHLINGQYEPTYVIKYAESVDGVNWHRHQDLCIESDFKLEAFSRPSVLFSDNYGYRMWYCHRDSVDYRDGAGSYRIGYAESVDGIKFWRAGNAIDVGDDGEWDSKQVCYPYIIELDGRMVMFYNGNGFGQTGIGYAVSKFI